MGLILPENMAKMTEIGCDVKVGKLKLEASKGAVMLARTRPSARDLGVAVGGRGRQRGWPGAAWFLT